MFKIPKYSSDCYEASQSGGGLLVFPIFSQFVKEPGNVSFRGVSAL